MIRLPLAPDGCYYKRGVTGTWYISGDANYWMPLRPYVARRLRARGLA